MMMMKQLVKVKRDKIESCMTCPLCEKLLRDATTISECLHTFCRKCIYKKLDDDEIDCCPICNIDLGCAPEDKLRQDHNLQDLRSKIFPLKRRKIRAPEVIPPMALPVRRKERSLSSLVVSTPQVSTQSGSTGRRAKSVTRKNAATLKGSKFSKEEDIKNEESQLENHLESLNLPETVNKIAQNKKQSSFNDEFYDPKTSNKDKEGGVKPWEGKVDMWKPLDCLVEAANRTKPFKFSSQGSATKSEPTEDPDGVEVDLPKLKKGRRIRKPKVQDEKNNTPTLDKPRNLRAGRNKASASEELSKTAQAILDASAKDRRGISPIWFRLVASEEKAGDAPLPQISACYLRIKDGNMAVSFIQKYLMKKLNLLSEDEVEIMCLGQPVISTLQLHNLVDLWLQTTPVTERVPAFMGTSAKDFVMVLAYSRKVHSS